MKAIGWFKNRRAPIAAFIISSVLAVLLLEILLRLAPGIVPPGLLFHFEPALRSRMAAGHLPILDDTVLLDRDDGGPPLRLWKPFVTVPYRDFDRIGDAIDPKTDEIGFCNPPGRYQRPTFDVITLGDSFTWCNAIDPSDSWTEQLAELTGLAVYNLGRGGVGPYEYLQILKRFGIAKRPRIVILNFYEGNDLRDAQRYHAHLQDSSESLPSVLGGAPGPSISLPGLTSGPLARQSRAVNLFTALLSWIRIRVSLYDSPVSAIDFRYRLAFEQANVEFNPANQDREEALFARRLANGQASFEILGPGLASYASLAVRHGFVPIVSYTPSAHTAYARQVVFEDPDLAAVMREFSLAQRSYLANGATRFGYRFFDCSSHLQAAAGAGGPNRLLYYRRNLHLTKRGHRVVAEAIKGFLERMGGEE